jgi:hypothetical protein
MKKYSFLYSILSVVVLVLAVTLLDSCKGDDDPSPADKNKKTISSGTWQVSSVTVGGVDQTALFTGFTLQFTSAGAYTSTNGAPVWGASGTWSFKDKTGIVVVRDDGKEVGVSTITKESLVLTMTWDKTTLGSGRVSSVAGEHVFTFTK